MSKHLVVAMVMVAWLALEEIARRGRGNGQIDACVNAVALLAWL